MVLSSQRIPALREDAEDADDDVDDALDDDVLELTLDDDTLSEVTDASSARAKAGRRSVATVTAPMSALGCIRGRGEVAS